MKRIAVDFSQEAGTIKPMHAVNNGPKMGGAWGVSNFEAYREAGIPCARNHDASFYAGYGGSHTVDVGNIFTDFDADENDPASYDFALTDEYCRSINAAGASILYRLGSRIEHESKKYQTYPPKDFAKWARICEHIIRHLVCGWADGLHLDIPYWEIWNEPDLKRADGSSPCWQGTPEQFLELYGTASTHLKKCFPELMIGGPAFTGSREGKPEVPEFVEFAEKNGLPLDFFSWHGYTTDPRVYAEQARFTRSLLDAHGYGAAKLILNEWNYVRGWDAKRIRESYGVMGSEKGAAFCAAAMLAAQKSPLDMFMYYDARPCPFNGLFAFDTLEVRKPYYSFWQFNKLYRLGTEVLSESSDPDLYVGAARGEGGAAVQLAYYAEETPEEADAEISFRGMAGKNEAVCFLVDEAHDCAEVRKDVFSSPEGTVRLTLKPYSTVLFRLSPV